MAGLTRRAMVKLAAAAGAAAAAGYGVWRALPPPAQETFAIDAAIPPERAFPLSVASGDPTPTGAVVWTRVAPERFDGAGPLGLEVAEDEAFARVVHRATLPASAFGPDRDHTARLDLDGLLRPDAFYHYRFVHRGAASRGGRLRTLPAPGQRAERLRLGVVTCQHYAAGYYGAYARLAEEDLDYLVHLGDLIYEGASGSVVPQRAVRLPSGEPRAMDLADFRFLHRLYRSDPHFQRALERHTLIAAQDDHEVANNRHWDYAEDRPRCPGHPLDDDAEALARMYREAQQAWTEYVPARVRLGPEAHLHDAFRLYRGFRAGDLAELFVTDERLYRDGPPCAGPQGFVPDCPERRAPGRTMLGEAQRTWLQRGLEGSGAVWKVWANEVLMMALRATPTFGATSLNADAWDGYAAEREAVLGAVRDRGVQNLVVLSGDMHACLAGYLLDRYDDGPLAGGARVGVEFMTPSVTSTHLRDQAAADQPGLEALLTEAAVRAANPHFVFFDGQQYGYSVLELTREAATFTIYAVDKLHDRADAERRVLRALRVPAGRVEIEDVTQPASTRASAAAVPTSASPTISPVASR